MDFTLTDELLALQEKTRRFIASEVIPMEADARQTSHGPAEALRRELIEKARDAGLLCPHASREMGGQGLSHVAKAIVFEEAGYSPLGPVAMNIHAPDEGNIHLMDVVATEAQKDRWLRPLVQGLSRSCFAMTEPAPGSGSDPSMLNTTAVRDGDDYLINGLKWLITGADGASFVIIMARMDDGSATMFLSDMQRPGIIQERQLHSLDSCFTGGHSVLRFDNLRVPASDVLGEIGKGFRYAQVRLAPARLTHCMRWLGAARRAHDIACDYARTRDSFGKPLGEHQGVGFMLADNQMDLHITRLAIWHCAWVLDQGLRANSDSSIAKVISAESLWRVVDRCVQILGGRGVTGETVVERIFRDIRPFRIYDGPSEVHRMSLAKKILDRHMGAV
ncbi:acyl-CoA dehydrogenase family protein [Azotobacter salinestris]|uniref:acyl-CoA dehydrogenase family protein n=1 Tax=Azotobacter salinestris TaxID=69964 RepID=UPI001266B468|nr:acyl-CoA dehydrogenase family protein [Azotobacter salinestris]